MIYKAKYAYIMNGISKNLNLTYSPHSTFWINIFSPMDYAFISSWCYIFFIYSDFNDMIIL